MYRCSISKRNIANTPHITPPFPGFIWASTAVIIAKNIITTMSTCNTFSPPPLNRCQFRFTQFVYLFLLIHPTDILYVYECFHHIRSPPPLNGCQFRRLPGLLRSPCLLARQKNRNVCIDKFLRGRR